MVLWLVASAALAQDPSSRLNSQLFRPAFDSEGTLWTEDARVRPDGYGTVRSFFQYANAPFRYRDASGDVTRAVSDLAELDVLGSVNWQHMRLGVHAPLYVYSASPEASNGAGLGDLALDLKGTILQREQSVVGLAMSGRLLLPTASVESALGASGTGWELTAIVDRRLGNFLLVGNVGTRGVPEATYETVGWGDQVFGRFGTGWLLPRNSGVSLDLSTQTNWASKYHPAGTAAEAMAGGWLPVTGDFVLRGGLSAGLSRSPGAPLFRGVVGVSWEPDPYPDRDLDGLVDREDRCPVQPEDIDTFDDDDGCPDRDAAIRLALSGDDGLPVESAYIEVTGPQDVTLDGHTQTRLHPGIYDVEVAADGYDTLRTQFVVPDTGEAVDVALQLTARVGGVRVWAVDPSGQRVPAAVSISGDTASPADGTAVDLPIGEHSLVITAEGYLADAVSLHVDRGEVREYTAVLSPAGRARVDVGADRLHLAEKVFFDKNKATIQPSSYGLLDEVATVLLAHPEIKRIEIGGHTDDRGSASHNQRLSADRASSVKQYLESKGVSPSRLRSVGYGESQPLTPGSSEDVWAKNRRVELRILDRG